MSHRRLNLGIVAHVDAGKTSLTERLLHAAGVIDEIGSVDAGTTRTDSLELERQRGITIRSAVVSFPVGGVVVNLIDTPGHPDFIAEVDRVLGVLDGAVLVVSAVEGVQPQTRVLFRALRRLNVPTLLFVNKIDRGGADGDRVVAAIARRLSAAVVPMGEVAGAGTRAARFTPWGSDNAAFRRGLTDVLTGVDDALLASYVEDERNVTYGRLRAVLGAQTRRARVHPVFFGSAITGAGVEPLIAGLVELLPAPVGDDAGPVSGRVFKVERGPAGQKIAYVRMFSGTIRTRDRWRSALGVDEKVTAVGVCDRGVWGQRPSVGAGEVGQLWGLGTIRVGDTIGEERAGTEAAAFGRPTLEAVVVPRRPDDKGALRAALERLAEQDPLINVRLDEAGEASISLYGEVQKEVIQATLASDFGLDVTFRDTTVVCVERPAVAGEAVEVLNGESNPFHATIGLRIEPAAPESGVEFRLRVDARTVPMYIYKSVDGYAAAMDSYVRRALQAGRFGWPVTDCVVTMFASNYSSADGPPSTRGPLSTAADFRKLTPLVVRQALDRAATVVCEPMLRVSLEVPPATVGAVLTALGRLGGSVRSQSLGDGEYATLETILSATKTSRLQRALPGLTGGEGVLESSLAGYQPVRGRAPIRYLRTPWPGTG